MTTLTLSWNNLSIDNMTNLYLYGQLDTPSDLQNENLIHQSDPKLISKDNPALTQVTLTDVSSFMTAGPGQYANGA